MVKLNNVIIFFQYHVLFSEDGSNMKYNNHKAGTLECARHKSYIKWYSDTLCTNMITGEHWTSIKQNSRVFSLTIYGKIIFATFSLSENLTICIQCLTTVNSVNKCCSVDIATFLSFSFTFQQSL